MKITNRLQLNMTDCNHSLRVSFCNGRIKKTSTIIEDIKRRMKWRALHVNEDGEIIQNEENKQRSIRRARNALVDIATLNKFEYFGTITINGKWHDIYNPVLITDKLLKFFNNYKVRKSSEFKYLLVPEYGEKNGRLHFHFLISGIPTEDLFLNEYKYLDWSPIRENFGHVQITKIGTTEQDRVRVAKYCAKYMSKDNIQIRTHRYFCSKGLEKPSRMAVYFPSVALAAKDWLERHGYIAYSHTRYSKSFALYTKDITPFIKFVNACIAKLKRKRVTFTLMPDTTPTPFD